VIKKVDKKQVSAQSSMRNPTSTRPRALFGIRPDDLMWSMSADFCRLSGHESFLPREELSRFQVLSRDLGEYGGNRRKAFDRLRRAEDLVLVIKESLNLSEILLSAKKPLPKPFLEGAMPSDRFPANC
jgi:hypothetical protein